MRPTLLAALAVALALIACTPKTPEGAACATLGGTGECPEGQRCGQDFRCSVAAVACDQIECSATTCSGNTLRRCVVTGACSAYADEVCDADAQTCDETAEACQCVASQGCTGVGTMCAGDPNSEVVCNKKNECPYFVRTEPCGSGKTCQGTGLGSGCQCPPVELAEDKSCDTVGATACAPAGQVALRCERFAAGSDCFVWKRTRNCETDGLECGAGACQCPALAVSGRTLLAEPGSAVDPDVTPVTPNGAAPVFCRFKTLEAALAAATDGDTVKVTAASLPATFTVPALTVKKGVTFTTTDDPLVPANYVLAPGDSVAGDTFITLEAGASLKGFEIRNRSATGSGIATSCPLDTDTQVVTIDKVNVFGAGSVTAASHFLHGISHSGKCSFSLLGSSVEGAVQSGVYVFPQSAVQLVFDGNVIQRNSATEFFTIDPAGGDRTGGGLVLRGATPQAVTFVGNQVIGNDGDQVLVFMSGAVSLSVQNCASRPNVIACYTAPGVGVSSVAQTLDVGHSIWPKDGTSLAPGVDYLTAPGKGVTGTGTACPVFAGTCPARP